MPDKSFFERNKIGARWWTLPSLKTKFKIIAPSSYFSDNKTWKKKTTDSCFDVTMGSFDEAERCERVGLYIRLKLEKYFQNQTLDYTKAMD